MVGLAGFESLRPLNNTAPDGIRQSSTPTTMKEREEYLRIRKQATYDQGAPDRREQFDARVRTALGSGVHTPQRWVEVARATAVRCGRCAGTGMFITGMVNGQPVGNGGQCFRCRGKGKQTYADGKRNMAYDRHLIDTIGL
jgi:hypothetical protein